MSSGRSGQLWSHTYTRKYNSNVGSWFISNSGKLLLWLGVFPETLLVPFTWASWFNPLDQVITKAGYYVHFIEVLWGSVVAQGHSWQGESQILSSESSTPHKVAFPESMEGLFLSVLGFHTCLLWLGLDHSRSPIITILGNHTVWLAFLQWVDLAQCKQFFLADNETS